MKLLAHQSAAVAHVMRSRKRSILIQSPVATGKTFIYAEIARRFAAKGKRVLVLAHREELIKQGVKRLQDFGLDPGVIKRGWKPDPTKRIQVASVPTLVRRDHPRADVVIVDEAHHSPAATYRKILANYPRARVIGLTATPVYGGDQRRSTLADVFGGDVYVAIEPANAVRQEVIAPFDGKVYTAPSLACVKQSHGDFRTTDLGEVMSQRHIVGDIVARWKKHQSGVSTILFAASLRQARRMVRAFRSAGVLAESLDGKTRKKDREETLGRFERGEFDVLVNVGLFTEGTDIARVKCIILARPTWSVGLFLQMVGRGRRVWNGQTCIIHDHGGLIDTHGLPDAEREWKLGGTATGVETVTCRKCNTARPIDVPRCPNKCRFPGNTGPSDPYWLRRGYEHEMLQYAEQKNAKIAEARRLCVEEGMTAKEAATATGLKYKTIQAWSAREGWLAVRPDLKQREELKAHRLFVDEKRSMTSTARTMGRSVAWVHALAKRRGWSRTKGEVRRLMSEARRDAHGGSKGRDAKILRLHARGWSSSKIAPCVGMVPGSVRCAIRRLTQIPDSR